MKNIILGNGKLVQVDDDKYEYLNQYKWSCRRAHNNTLIDYAFRTIPRIDGAKYKNGKTKRTMIQMHRELLSPSEDMCVDHIDGNGLNNQLANLRLATKSQNLRNSKLNKRNTTGYKGVKKSGNGWQARINFNKKEINLGSYSNPIRAAKAYDKAARLYFGEFARLNFNEP